MKRALLSLAVAAALLSPARAQSPEDTAAIKATARDYMQLGKVDGRWVIINVLWEMKPKAG